MIDRLANHRVARTYVATRDQLARLPFWVRVIVILGAGVYGMIRKK